MTLIKSEDELTKTPKSSLGVSGTIIPQMYDWCVEIGIVLSNEQAIKLSALITNLQRQHERELVEARLDELKNIMSHLVIYHGDKPARAVSTAKIRGRIAQLEQLTTNQEGEYQ